MSTRSRSPGLELQRDDGAAAVDEQIAGALHLLQDEAFAAEEAGAEPLRERDAQVDVADGAEERVALAEHLLAVRAAMWMILPGYGPANASFAPAAVAREVGDEQALAGQELPFQAAEQAALHLRLHVDRVGHVHQRARFRAHDLARRRA